MMAAMLFLLYNGDRRRIHGGFRCVWILLQLLSWTTILLLSSAVVVNGFVVVVAPTTTTRSRRKIVVVPPPPPHAAGAAAPAAGRSKSYSSSSLFAFLRRTKKPSDDNDGDKGGGRKSKPWIRRKEGSSKTTTTTTATTTTATKTKKKKKRKDDGVVVVSGYSLGLRSYHPAARRQLRPIVKFFSEDSFGPYALSVQSNQQLVAQSPNPKQNNFGALEPRIVRFHVHVNDDGHDHNNNNNNNKTTSTSSSSSTKQPLVILPNGAAKNPRQTLQFTNKYYDEKDDDDTTVSAYKNRPMFIPVAPHMTTTRTMNGAATAAQKQQFPPIQLLQLSTPFTTSSSSAMGSNRTTPISLAENLLQLAPKMVSEVSSTIWNASSLWNHSAAASVMLWNASSLWNDASLWNTSSSLPATTVTSGDGGMPTTTTNTTTLATRTMTKTNKTASSSGSSYTSSLAENIMQYMMEQAGTAMLQQQQQSNNITKSRGGSTSTSGTNNNNKQNRTMPEVSVTTPTTSTMTKKQFQPRSKALGSPMKQQQQPPASSILDTIGKAPNDTLTLQDLDRILRSNGYVRQSELSSIRQGILTSTANDLEGIGKPVTAQQHALKVSSSTKDSKNVAFPQPSVLSYESLKWGTMASSSLFFMLVGTALLPSLWLVGVLMGAFYGYDIGTQLPDRTPTAVLPGLLVRMGTRIARTSLQLYDYSVALMFMWKTGVLSYEYWKRYAVLDQKFGIQEKLDAWNARFIEGKENFDKWERENEVGRKVLATLRTFWLVEERSLQKVGLNKKKQQQRKQSKYRLVQLLYDVAYSMGKFIGSLWKLFTGGGSTELAEFLRGIQMDILSSFTRMGVEGMGARIGSILVAVVAVNMIGALYTISPALLLLLTTLVSFIWPTWVNELVDRIEQLFQDTRAIGRGEEPSSLITSNTNILQQQQQGQHQLPQQRPRLRTKKDKKRYHYFMTTDGKKRFYRTGQPIWPWTRKQHQQEEQKNKSGFLGFLKGG